jgi:hypothetical protein
MRLSQHLPDDLRDKRGAQAWAVPERGSFRCPGAGHRPSVGLGAAPFIASPLAAIFTMGSGAIGAFFHAGRGRSGGFRDAAMQSR